MNQRTVSVVCRPEQGPNNEPRIGLYWYDNNSANMEEDWFINQTVISLNDMHRKLELVAKQYKEMGTPVSFIIHGSVYTIMWR